MNDNNRDHSNNDLTDDVYSHIDHDSVDLKQTNNNNLYTLTDNKLQLSSDLEDLDWNSIYSHKGELIIAYDNKVRYKTLHPRAFYALYVKPNEEGSGHLIFRLSTDQIVVTKECQSIPVPENLIEAISETESYGNKNQTNCFDTNHSIIQDGHSNNNDNYGYIYPIDMDDSEDESYDKLDCSQ